MGFQTLGGRKAHPTPLVPWMASMRGCPERQDGVLCGCGPHNPRQPLTRQFWTPQSRQDTSWLRQQWSIFDSTPPATFLPSLNLPTVYLQESMATKGKHRAGCLWGTRVCVRLFDGSFVWVIVCLGGCVFECIRRFECVCVCSRADILLFSCGYMSVV